MAPAQRPVSAGGSEAGGGSSDDAAGPPARSGDEAATWFELEPPLARAGWTAGRRLVRRARASWMLWVTLAFVVGGALTVKLMRTPARYEVTTLLRVTEGLYDERGSDLTGRALRTHVGQLVFSSQHLLALMRRHADWFPKLKTDETAALDGMREAMNVSISENGFSEDRGAGDPPRAAWIEVGFRAPTPDAAWIVAHELGELLVGSTLAVQRAALEGEEAAAKEALRRAQHDLSAFAGGGTAGSSPGLLAARERWRAAQSAAATASMAVHAASARQQLRFELVDPGRKPDPLSDVGPLVTRFLSAFVLTLLAGWLLAGAFDPRILEAHDIEPFGLPLLGGLPRLPVGLPADGGGPRRPRV